MKLAVLAATLVLAASSADAAVMCTMIAYPKTPDAVLQSEKNWVAALEERNAASLECLLAPSFKETTWDGQLVTRADILANIEKRPALKIALSDLSAELLGDTAIVRGLNTVQQSGGGQPVRVRFTDVFVYQSGKWKPVSAQETLVRDQRE